jgi:hypothetical protein
MKIGARVKVHREKLVPLRKGEVTREKVDLAKSRIQSEGLVRILKGRRLPNGDIQFAGGHNLWVALDELQYEGLIDVQLYEDCTQEEFGEMYLGDNSAVDNNCTRWALHAVSHPVVLLGSDYHAKSSSEKDAKIARRMGINHKHIPMLREMAEAIKAQTLAPEVKDILSIDLAVYFWKQVRDRGMIPLAAQKTYLIELLPRLRADAPDGTATLDPISRMRKWSEPFGSGKTRRAKSNFTGARKLNLAEQVDKARVGLENVNNVIENDDDPEVDDDIKQALLDQCELFIQNCDDAENEESNG